MNDIISKLGECVEFGKINLASPYPPAMKGLPGADELTREALENGGSPQSILSESLIPAMNRVGNKFTEGKIFVPQMLLSAKAMNSAMKHLKPYFQSGEIKRKGVFVIGTVMGVLILAILSNGLNLLSVPSFYQEVIRGVVLIMAVIFDMMKERKKD